MLRHVSVPAAAVRAHLNMPSTCCRLQCVPVPCKVANVSEVLCLVLRILGHFKFNSKVASPSAMQAFCRQQEAADDETLAAAAEVDEMYDLLAFYGRQAVPTNDQVTACVIFVVVQMKGVKALMKWHASGGDPVVHDAYALPWLLGLRCRLTAGWRGRRPDSHPRSGPQKIVATWDCRPSLVMSCFVARRSSTTT